MDAADHPGPHAAFLSRPVTALYGVGPERAALLEKLGLRTVEDLILHAPRRYEDRRRLTAIHALQKGVEAVVLGKVIACGVKWFAHRRKSIFELILEDGTGRLHGQWWNMPFLERQYSVGQQVVMFGKIRQLKPRTMDHPEAEVIESGDEEFLHLGRLAPVYPLTQGLGQRWLRGLIWRTAEGARAHLPEPCPEAGPLLARHHLPTRAEAVRMLHFPNQDDEPPLARRRLALDEFLQLQLRVQARRRQFFRHVPGLPCQGDNRLIRPFLRELNFELTGAQTRVLRGLRQDLGSSPPMRRLLQGDVGSGKTVIAACCALMAIESGFGVALMAPTEILAEQHFATFNRWFSPLGVGVGLRTGSQERMGDAAPPVPGVQQGRLWIGTHALLTEGVEFPNLGLVIIDEQHRFGVAQREQLVRKGAYPHLLVMTATPIPRTLGLTLYGDLDVSILDELPPGRGVIQTFVRAAAQLPKVMEFIRAQLARGRQAYIVHPRVEEGGGAGGLKAVMLEHGRLQEQLSPWQVGLLHGRLRPAEKDRVMEEFRAGRLQVLLSTSLIEVGVDVPNATVMLVENAEQFGLAQLHQLRGRIGRGPARSYCILVAAARTPGAQQRLKILEQTTDGFQIAEEDLKLRGPGELLGRQQSGLPAFRFGDFNTDADLVLLARQIALAK